MDNVPPGLQADTDNQFEHDIARIVSDNLRTAFSHSGVSRRAQHAKNHGCCAATLEVLDNLPSDFGTGIFRARAKYKCWIRFSNGSTFDDRKPDAHGMAIKVIGVVGDRLDNVFSSQSEQDFLLVDSPTFFQSR